MGKTKWKVRNPNLVSIRRSFFLVLLTALTIMRFIQSITLHMWFAFPQKADDQLLMSYSFDDYVESTSHYKLAKNQAYGFFLKVVGWSHINVDIVYFIVWFLAAVLMACAIQSFFSKAWLSAFAYVYILWNPLAFENWQGTRLYRNSILTPAICLLLSLLMLYMASTTALWSATGKSDKRSASLAVNGNKTQTRSTLVRSLALWFGVICLVIFLGLTFAFVYDLKEDSLWLVPVYLFIVMVQVFRVVRSQADRMTKLLVIVLCLLPLLVSYAGIQSIKAYNKRHFGVSLLNTRTSGEIAKFVSFTYQVKSKDQTPHIWSPADSIEAVANASPTLKSEPGILDFIEHQDFAAPDIHVHPLTGDFLSWQMLAAIDRTIGMDDEQRVQEFFHQVNTEVEAAFKDGRLKRTDKFTPSSNLVPRQPDQIAGLLGPSFRMFLNSCTLLELYEVSHDVNQTNRNIYNRKGLAQVNVDINNPNPQPVSWFSIEKARTVARLDVRLYRIVNLVLALIFLMALCKAIRAAAAERNLADLAFPGLSLCLFIYAFAYSFFVAWYIEYLDNVYAQFFYTTSSITPFIVIGLLIGLGCFSMQCDKRMQHRKHATNDAPLEAKDSPSMIQQDQDAPIL